MGVLSIEQAGGIDENKCDRLPLLTGGTFQQCGHFFSGCSFMKYGVLLAITEVASGRR
jgi:hypothetical protein